MREFLRGWRRKAGLVTLAMACVLTVAWMRSCVVGDTLRVQFRQSPREALSYGALSVHHGVKLSRNWACWMGDSFPPTYHFGPEHDSAKAADFAGWPDDDEELDWFWSGNGFYVGGALFWHQTTLLGSIVISYSLLVLPLTLLSAWLLLIKPRPAKSAKESSRA